MTRIVGGTARGRRLAVPAKGTRPTSDRAREALFNTLAGLIELPGARALDLYAGSGAIGLEALSRGASQVTFVENDRRALAVLRANIEAVGLPGAEVRPAPLPGYLVTAGAAEPYDLIFADPPYATPDPAIAALLDGLVDPRWLSAAGVVVLERSARSPEPAWPAVLEPVKSRRYGDGTLWYGRRR